MPADYMMVPYLWRRQLALVRAALALAVLVAYLMLPAPYGTLAAVAALFYLLCSVGVLVHRRLEQASYRPLGLAVDAAGAALCLLHPAPTVRWLGMVFYFYLLLAGVLVHERERVLALVGGALLAVIIAQPPDFAFLWPVTLLAGILACLLVVHRGFMQERLSHALRRAVLARSEAAVARIQERERIAHDFHDGPLQSFISFQMRLELVRKLLARNPEEGRRELVQLQDLCKIQINELRSFVRAMRTTEEDAASLDAALRQLIRSFQNDTGMSATLVAEEFTSPSDTDTAMEVLQIVREALNNVQKHSKASRVTVTLRNENDRITVSVEDDGGGFPFSGAFALDELDALRLGPASIKRRVKSLGGELTVESRPGRGALVRVRVPA